MAGKEKLRKYPIYEELSEAYEYYNKELFGKDLPECIIILSKKEKSFGHFMPNNFVAFDDRDVKKHEIALNVQMFAIRKIELTLSTLVHEMCHLKTFEDGDYGRGGYHNKIWAKLMKGVGLVPSSTGREGGNETGQHVSHYIELGGLFERKTRTLLDNGFFISFVEYVSEEIKSFYEEEIKEREVRGKPGFYVDDNGEEFEGRTVSCGRDDNGKEIISIVEKGRNNKTLYLCPCDKRVWGKGGLNIKCNICGKNFKEIG